jgi:hypothetical protein
MRRLVPWVMAAVMVAGCGSDSTSPTVASVAGSYHATTFTATNGSGAIDLLAAGASVTAVLDANGTTTGHLLVPAAVTGTTPIDEDLTGTWTLANNQVTFNQSADTFLRGVVFNVSGNTLVGNGAFSGTTLHVVLSK